MIFVFVYDKPTIVYHFLGNCHDTYCCDTIIVSLSQVGGIVVTNRPDCKNGQYQTCIKQGDMLLNRVQKLSRVINI